MKRIKLLLFLSLIVFSIGAQTRVVAHRGFWKTDGSAQNSIASLSKADSIGAYGSEFDVWLTADDSLVVNHDRVFKGINFPEATAAEVASIRLDNGESVPTLAEYLNEAKKYPDLRLVLEVKTYGDDSARQTLACQKIVDMVDASGLRDRTDYIAFSLFACKELHRLSPDRPVYYLEGDLSPKEVKELGFAGIDYSYKALSKHPEWIEEAKNEGLEINVWTVDSPEIMQELIDKKVDFITTNRPDLLLQLLN
ncbi:MAG: glycerophosphodiester phosphodiesterase [Muribaculaceae bacterium]|nr:glycerophosphodiester phosphodiesterase [Muribaculaceae bacterium]